MQAATWIARIWGALLAFGLGLAFGDDVPTPEEMKEKLEAFDSIFDAAISFRGELKVTPNELDVGQPVVDYRFVFTNQAPRHAFFREALRVPPPTQPPPALGDGRQSGISATVEKSEAVYFDDKYSGNLTTWNIFKFEEGKPTNIGETNAVNLEPWSAATLTLPYKAVAWTSGHCFAKHLNKITAVRRHDDGQKLVVEAEGFESEVNPGTWELVVDPSAGYCVRNAAFKNLQGDVAVSMNNSGQKEIDGFPFPETGRFSFAGAATYDFTFLTAALTVDEELLAETKSAVDNRKLPNTLVVDARFGPASLARVDGDGRFLQHQARSESVPRVLPIATPSLRRWILLTLNVVVFGAIGIVMWRSKTEQSKKLTS